MTSSNTRPIQAETVVASLTSAIGQLIRRMRADANPGGLNFSQTATLARLDDEGATTTADLARAESMKPQSMATILSGLEEEGLVVRSPHPTDGRQILFSLTQEGIEARRKRTAAKQKWLLAKVAKLDRAEQQTLLAAAALISRLGEP